jgi:hypothetical protein
VVKDNELVFDRHAGREQVRDGRDDAARRKIAAAVIIAADNQDAWMTTAGRTDQIVKLFKVIVVPGQQTSIRSDCPVKMYRIRASDQSGISRQFNVVTGVLEQSDEQRIDAIVIEVQPHAPRASRCLTNCSSTSR